jgi:V/A-type H+-transporting ATPase subunit D
MDDKRYGLLRERARLLDLVNEARETWQRAVAEADTWLARAALVSGQRSFELASFHVPERAEVRVTVHRSLGVSYASDPEVRLPRTGDEVAPGGSAALPEASRAYGQAVEAGARFGAAAAALERVDAELAATTRRLRALERRWIPAHEEALARLALALDESEREDAMRVRWLVDRLAAESAGGGSSPA